jgi:hypothetical protein
VFDGFIGGCLFISQADSGWFTVIFWGTFVSGVDLLYLFPVNRVKVSNFTDDLCYHYVLWVFGRDCGWCDGVALILVT